MLFSLLIFFIVSIIVLCLLPKNYIFVKTTEICIFLFNFFLIVTLYYFLSYNKLYDQEYSFQLVFSENFYLKFVLDELSIFFIFLTIFLLPPSVLYLSLNYYFLKSENTQYRPNNYKTNLHSIIAFENTITDFKYVTNNFRYFTLLLFILTIFLILFFLTNDLLFFYICFEFVLIPVFLIIIYWGSRSRKILSAYYFFLYTFIGSLFFLFSLFLIYFELQTFNIEELLFFSFPIWLQKIIWPCFFISLAVKIPMIPFHLWLPEAHVEAPTVGSVYLASILLKLGGYGFVRLLLELLPEATIYYASYAQTLALFSVFLSSLVILVQADIKKIIAYSSIAHMNFAVVGIFAYGLNALYGSLYLMIAHGITSGALFFLVGILYDRHKTRIVYYYGRLMSLMPIFSFFFFIFSFANVGFPGTINFIGEILLVLGVIEYSFITHSFFPFLIIFVGIFFSVCYSIWLINKLLFGNLKWSFQHPIKFYDFTFDEFLVLFPFLFFVIFFGLTDAGLNLLKNYSYYIISLFF